MAHPRQIAASTLLQGEGYPVESAAAWVGTFSQESGVNLPSAFRHGRLDHGSQGLPQWRLDRLTKYIGYVKALHPIASEDELWVLYGNMALQLKYVAIECGRDYHALDLRLRKGGDIDALSEAICWDFERPNRALSGIENRKRQARAVFDASVHIHPSEHTKTNVDVSTAKKAVAKSRASFGVGTVASGAAVFLAFAENLPHGVVAVVLVIAVAAIIHSFAAAKTAVAKIPGATLRDVQPPGLVPIAHDAATATTQWPSMTTPVAIPAAPPPHAPLEWSQHDIDAVAHEVADLLKSTPLTQEAKP